MRAWRTAYGAKKYCALFKHPSFWVMFVKARAVMWLTKRYFSRSDGAEKIIVQCPLLMLWTAPPPARECHECGCC